MRQRALTQLVIPAALVDSESTHEMLVLGGRLFEQRKATLEALDKIDGVDYVTNHAAFYLFRGWTRASLILRMRTTSR